MYISNNSNIGMATVLQQQQQQQQNQNQKNCMKTLTNGSSNDPTANHNKWRWQQQFENAALNMQYGMKSHPQHPTSHIIAANNNPSTYNSYNHTITQENAIATGVCDSAGGTGDNTESEATAIADVSAADPPPANENESAVVAENAAEEDPQPEIDIMINNVVCSFSVRCHLNLREIAQNGFNVEYRRENGMVTMKLRRPYTTASIWSSGRITCTGATSEDQARIAARRYARCLEKLGFRTRFHNFRVVNVLGTCSMPWAIKIVNFSERYKKEASYEPELHPGVTYKIRYPKATLKIFSTGSITVTASCVLNIQAAIEHIFPLVYEFRKERTPEEKLALRNKQRERNLAAGIIDIGVHKQENSTVPDNAVGSNAADSLVLLQRKRQMTTETVVGMNNKKRLLNGGNTYNLDDVEYIDEPSDGEEPKFKYTQFDDPEDLIEGPDDEDEDDL